MQLIEILSAVLNFRCKANHCVDDDVYVMQVDAKTGSVEAGVIYVTSAATSGGLLPGVLTATKQKKNSIL